MSGAVPHPPPEPVNPLARPCRVCKFLLSEGEVQRVLGSGGSNPPLLWQMEGAIGERGRTVYI